MVSEVVRRGGSDPRVAIRALRLAALIGAVITGLLAMHVLGMHASPHAGSEAVTMSEAVSTGPHTATGAGDPAGTGDMCATCGGGDEVGMAIACAIALLVALLLLTPRRPVMGRAGPLATLLIAPANPRTTLFPAPLRHALCIMRT